MKLWNYIKGFRKGKEAHRLEKEAMKDPFLAHALRGFDKVKGDHATRIEQLQKDVNKRRAKKPNYLRAAGIAASILIVFGLGTYALLDTTHTYEEQIAVFNEILPEPKLSAPVPPMDNREEELAVADIAEPEEPTPPARFESESFAIEETHHEDEEIAKEDVQLDEVVVTGYPAARTRTLTGAVQEVRATPRSVIKGKVTDDLGEPIAGANVVIPGTNQGTLTNTDGYFELPASDSTTIRVAYLGYESLVIPVDTGEVMHIAMHSDNQMLDEMVVSGYGTEKKKDLKAQEPKPVDGKRKFRKYIKDNMVRPVDDECRDAKGKVVLRFHVYEDGRPVEITVEKNLCPAADEEAIRLLSEGPDWTLGTASTTVEIKF